MNKINSIRKDWSLIETLIAQDRKILDIGCGDGGLMEQLENNRNAITHGIELNRDLAANAIARGFNVVHGNAELDLSQYSNNSFDYVILSQTLQAMMKPKDILSELLRIGSNFEKKILKIQKEVFKISKKEFNIASPKQLGEILYNELKIN